MIRIKRTYEPTKRGDGWRVLVERLWPRGMKKEALDADAWLKDVAPSTELRQWFAHRIDRWEEFQRRYQEELEANRPAWKPILEASRRGTVTLLYSAHDTEHNGAMVLRDFMAKRRPPRRPSRTLYTIGHSTRPLDELIGILREWEITRLVDIRTIPRSRTNPQFNGDVLPSTLGAAGISYVQMAALGGRRGKSKSAGPRVNAGWQVQAFRNYADYARTPAFRAGLRALLVMASNETCAIMCAEAVWWRCHRRIVTDHVLAHGVPVIHLFSREKGEPASLTPFAHVGARYYISYPAP